MPAGRAFTDCLSRLRATAMPFAVYTSTVSAVPARMSFTPDASETAAYHKRPFHSISVKIILHGISISHIAERENTGQRWRERDSSRRKQQPVVAFLISAAIRTFDFNRLQVRMDCQDF